MRRMRIVILSGAKGFAIGERVCVVEGPLCLFPLHGGHKAFASECSCQGTAATKRIPCEASSEVKLQGVLRLRNAARCARHYFAQDDRRLRLPCILTVALWLNL